MSGIRFKSKERWMTRNWIFQLFFELVIEENQTNNELCEILKRAIYHNGLHLDRSKPGQKVTAEEILQSLVKTARSIDRQKVLKMTNLEVQGKLMFLEAISDFLEAVSKQNE